jgi:hypothetical protein
MGARFHHHGAATMYRVHSFARVRLSVPIATLDELSVEADRDEEGYLVRREE